jgi:hypothetical protein
LFVIPSDISSVSSTTIQVCQFTLSTAHHPPPHQVELIVTEFPVLDTVMLVQATIVSTGLFAIWSKIDLLECVCLAEVFAATFVFSVLS